MRRMTAFGKLHCRDDHTNEGQVWAVHVGRTEALVQDCGVAAKVWIEAALTNTELRTNVCSQKASRKHDKSTSGFAKGL